MGQGCYSGAGEQYGDFYLANFLYKYNVAELGFCKPLLCGASAFAVPLGCACRSLRLCLPFLWAHGVANGGGVSGRGTLYRFYDVSELM